MASPFQSAIEAVLKPLEFAARDDFAQLPRVRNLESSVSDAARRAGALAIPRDARDGLRRLQRAFEARNQSAEEPVRVRIGLNAGEPIAEEEDLFGTAVIMAARIAGKAEGGTILASDVVRQLVAGKDFEFMDQGEVSLKGFEEPVRAWSVEWA